MEAAVRDIFRVVAPIAEAFLTNINKNRPTRRRIAKPRMVSRGTVRRYVKLHLKTDYEMMNLSSNLFCLPKSIMIAILVKTKYTIKVLRNLAKRKIRYFLT